MPARARLFVRSFNLQWYTLLLPGTPSLKTLEREKNIMQKVNGEGTREDHDGHDSMVVRSWMMAQRDV